MRLVPTHSLRDNSEVAIDIVNDQGKLLLKSHQILSGNMLNSLRGKGIRYVYITDQYCRNTAHIRNQMKAQEGNQQYINEMRNIAKKMMAGTAGAAEMERGWAIALQIVEDIKSRGENFKIFYEPTKMVIDSVVEECIYVAIMSVALALKLGISEEETRKLCMSALLKDMALLSAKIPLNDKKSGIMHPIACYEYLKKNYQLDEDILLGVLHHEEHYDGTGNPNHLRGEQIHKFARVIGMIDMYYKINTDSDMACDSHGVFENKVKALMSKVDPIVFECFVQNTEIFMLDTLVRLNNGDVGIIVANSYQDVFCPKVEIVQSERFEKGTVIDLQKEDRLKIKNIEYYVT